MKDLFSAEQQRDLHRRGFTRRDFGRLAALATAGAALPFYNEAVMAQGLSAVRNLPPDAVRINANENPMGPCPEAIEAIQKLVPLGGRYLYNETFAFTDAMAATENLSQDHVMPFAGSSDPLHRVVLAFTGPERSFVVADPGYEAGGRPPSSSGPRRSRSRSARTGRTTSGRWPRPTRVRVSSTSATPITRPARSRPGTRSSIWSPTSPRMRSSCWTRRISICRRRRSPVRRWSLPART